MPQSQQDSRDSLIDPHYFDEFLKLAHAAFGAIADKEYLRQGLYAITNENATVELKFTRLFSALETLVLKHRRDVGNEFVIPPDRWNNVEKNLKAAVKQSPEFANDTNRRSQIYENLSGLNRISLRSAYSGFCSQYQLDLDDLWPVCGVQNFTTLTKIRNQLVHGVPFTRAQFDVLAIATQHLEWIMERTLLNLLGWDAKKSRASRNSLQQMTAYSKWKQLSFD